jgi:hypothetical protein
MQVKELISSSEILHAAPHYSLVIPAEVYITMPDVVPISLALHHKSVGRNVKPMWAGTSHGKDRHETKGEERGRYNIREHRHRGCRATARPPNKCRLLERL